MIIREAEKGELSQWPSAENGQIKLVLDEDGMKGFIAMTRLEMPEGIDPQFWIHDVAHWGTDPRGFLMLCSKARKVGKDLGFTEVRTNVPKDSPLLKIWLSKGFEIEQYLLKGEL